MEFQQKFQICILHLEAQLKTQDVAVAMTKGNPSISPSVRCSNEAVTCKHTREDKVKSSE